MPKFRRYLPLLAAATALALGTASNANAAPAFEIDPTALVAAGEIFTATDVSGTSNATIRQTGPSTQEETGYLLFNSFTNEGSTVSNVDSRLVLTDNLGDDDLTVYNLYATFNATVEGITGFGAGQSGTIAPGDFSFDLFADIGSDNTFTAGSTNAIAGTDPTITDTADDVILATGTSVSGSAGFQAATGAPIFAVVSSFIICNGIVGQGFHGDELVIGGDASSCGTFDAREYFFSPNPFYAFNFTSTTAGSANNLTVNAGALVPHATLNGIVVDVNFVPEPGSLALLGVGLVALGFGWRSRKVLGK